MRIRVSYAVAHRFAKLKAVCASCVHGFFVIPQVNTKKVAKNDKIVNSGSLES